MKKVTFTAFALMIGALMTLTGCNSMCSKDKGACSKKGMSAEASCPVGCGCSKCAAMK